jgi:signal transduction histidine kinase
MRILIVEDEPDLLRVLLRALPEDDHTFTSLDKVFTQQKRFSTDVAHELRTPVSVLITESQIALERERSGEDYRETIATCLHSARRMAGLIEALLGLGQIESASDAPRASCALAALTRKIMDSLQSMAGSHDIELRAQLDTSPCEANAEQIFSAGPLIASVDDLLTQLEALFSSFPAICRPKESGLQFPEDRFFVGGCWSVNSARRYQSLPTNAPLPTEREVKSASM